MTLPGWIRLPGQLVIVLCVATFAAKTATAQTCPITRPGPEPKVERAVSVKQLQSRLRRCGDGRSCSKDVRQFYGITRIVGYMVDRENRDIVVLGSVDPGAPALDVEDFIVALRNLKLRYAEQRGNTIYYSYPAVSIDPNPNVLRDLERIMAGISGSSGIGTLNRALRD